MLKYNNSLKYDDAHDKFPSFYILTAYFVCLCRVHTTLLLLYLTITIVEYCNHLIQHIE